MATSERDNIRRAAPAAAAVRKSTPAAARPVEERKVILAPTAPSGVDGLSVFGAVFAAFVSLAAHVLLILLIWSIPVVSQASDLLTIKKKEDPLAVKKTEEEEKKEEKEEKVDLDLTNMKEGNPDLAMEELNLPAERIQEVVSPGPVNINETPGVETVMPPSDTTVITSPKGLGGGDPTGLSIGIKGDNGIGLPGGDFGVGNGGTQNGFGEFQGAFQGRSASMRDKMVSEGGGNKESEAAVASGLMWLALHQGQDGHWSMNNFNQMAREKPYPAGKIYKYDYGAAMGLGTHPDEVAATSLALLPFLAAGQTHKASKDNNEANKYHKGILQGLTYLINKQNKTSGQLSGNFYAHGIASIVLCEAYGLTSDPMLKGPAQKALDYLVATQNDGGGWRYAPKEAGDLSVTGWQLMALKSGQMSGLRVPVGTLRGAERFVESCEVQDSGTYTYIAGGGATPSMTATGMLCRQYLGVNPRNPKLGKGVEFIKRNPPTSSDLYYLYYATQVMHHMGGDAWAYWNEGPNKNDGIRDTLVRQMTRSPADGRTAMLNGSWFYPNGHTAPGGRLMSTSLCLLCLEVYYRHLPLYRGEVTETKPAN
jgi:hypothetical protein